MITLTEEELEAIKRQNQQIGAISAILDNCLFLIKTSNNNLDEDFKKLDEIKKRLDEKDTLDFGPRD
jgi:hypothetical protein